MLSLSTFLALGLSELYFQYLGPLQFRISVPHPVVHRVHKPNSTYLESSPFQEDEYAVLVRFNKQGVRANADYTIPKPKGVQRILFLGDSFVEARQVSIDKTMTCLVEKNLRKTSPQIQVINAGMSGNGPLLEYMWLREIGLKLEPDVVVQFFFQNDVFDDHLHARTMIKDQTGQIVAVPSPLLSRRPPKGRQRGKLFRWANSTRDALLKTAVMRVCRRTLSPPPAHPVKPFFKPDAGIAQNPFAVFRDTYSKQDERLWKHTIHHLKLTNELARSNNIRYLLVVIPLPPQVSAQQWAVGRERWGIPTGQRLESTKPQQILKAFANKKGIGLIDLLPGFQAHAKQTGEALFFTVDGHWTEAGNQLAADIVLEHLPPVLTSLKKVPGE